MGGRVRAALRSGTRGFRDQGADAARVVRLVPRPDRADRPVTTTAPAALAEPLVPVRRGWVALLVLANLGVFMGFFTPIQVLLPEQIAAIDPGHKEAMLGLVTGLGAAAAVVVNPVAGALSDRTVWRFGRRHARPREPAALCARGHASLRDAMNIALIRSRSR